MPALAESVLTQLAQISLVEAIAAAAAVAYLVLAIRESVWCWPCACLSTLLYISVFLDARLYMESVLNAFYLGMAVYGWVHWARGVRGTGRLPVTRLAWRRHALAIGILLSLAAINGRLLATWTDAAYPYVDSLTTWGALWATWLVARKIFENWWYWLVIDAVSMAVYWLRDLDLTAALFLLYLVLIPFGMLRWRKSLVPAPA